MSKCKYCGMSVRLAQFRDGWDWIHNDTGNWGCHIQIDGQWKYADSDDSKLKLYEPKDPDGVPGKVGYKITLTSGFTSVTYPGEPTPPPAPKVKELPVVREVKGRKFREEEE